MTLIFDIAGFRADVITKRKIQLNISIQELSELIPLSKATISRVENSKSIEMTTFVVLCSWLNVSPEKYIYKK